jgi:hypothetical protein
MRVLRVEGWVGLAGLVAGEDLRLEVGGLSQAEPKPWRMHGGACAGPRFLRLASLFFFRDPSSSQLQTLPHL